jgi:hypothetical protein
MSSSLDIMPAVRRSEVQVQCVEMLSSLLRMLEVQVQEQRAWDDIVTLDES